MCILNLIFDLIALFADWQIDGKDSESEREVSEPAGVPPLSFVRGRDGVRVRVTADGEDVNGVQEEIETHIFDLPVARSKVQPLHYGKFISCLSKSKSNSSVYSVSGVSFYVLIFIRLLK
jgi:hypothetical protein